MKNTYRLVTIASLVVLSVVFLMTYTALAKELPILVEVSDLGEKYEGKRVAVMAWARSAQIMRGRRGSNYVKTEIAKEKDTVTVYTAFPLYNIVNNRVIVQGIYHQRGRYGGFLADHFIIADTVFRDWEEYKQKSSDK